MNNNDYLTQTTLIAYNKSDYKMIDIDDVEKLNISYDGHIKWFNSYGKVSKETLKKIITNNEINDFLSILYFDEYSNKVISLDENLFVGIKVFRVDDGVYSTEKMAFVLGENFIWSIQEKTGDYFEWIRERIKFNKGLVRNKKADYLFFLILDAIVDNYEKVFYTISEYNQKFSDILSLKPTPEIISDIEDKKKELLMLKKSAALLRDTINKLLKTDLSTLDTMYFDEIKEQVNNLIIDIEFEIQTLESNINLIFSIQGHHLNEVMKTLTVFSIIFIPITFLAGIYGMNFNNMPELQIQNGYFILLGVMCAITISIIIYLKRKKWF